MDSFTSRELRGASPAFATQGATRLLGRWGGQALKEILHHKDAVLYPRPMSWSTAASTAIPALGVVVALFALLYSRSSVKQSEKSVAEAKRAADAAERSAGAAVSTAEAARAQDRRARRPRLRVVIDQLAPHDGVSVIFRIIHDGPADLESVVVHQPASSELDGRIVHPVARIGGEWATTAEVGPIEMGAHARFILSLGSSPTLPPFAVKIVSRIGDERWSEVAHLEETRGPRPSSAWH